MSDTRMRIVIGAEVRDALRGLEDVQDRMRSTAASGQSFGKGIETSAVKASKALADVKKPSNDATQSLINLSRVAQDAPYGFIGIANNLNPLLEGFQRLSVSAKAAGTSVGKELVNALKGPAGIGVALSVVSSLLVVFGGKLFGASAEAEAAKKKMDAYKESLDAINSSVAKEAAQVSSLVLVLKNETETRERKLGAIKELQAISPEVFKNLQLEGSLVSGLDAAYQNYLSNLEKVIEAKILQAKLEENIKGKLDQQAAVSKFLSTSTEGRKMSLEESLKANEEFIKLEREKAKFDQSSLRFLAKAQQNDQQLLKTKQEIGKLDAENLEILKRLQELTPAIKVNVSPKTENVKKEAEDVLKNISPLPQLPVEIIPVIPNVGREVLNELKAEQEKLAKIFNPRIEESTAKLGGIRQRRTPLTDVLGENFKVELELARQKASELADEIGDRLSPLVSSLFDVLTGQAPIKSFFDSILGVIKQVTVELGVAALKALLFKTILSGLAPGAGAVGGLFSGGGAGGSWGVAGLGNIGAGNINISGRLVGSGTDLVAVIGNTNLSMGRSF